MMLIHRASSRPKDAAEKEDREAANHDQSHIRAPCWVSEWDPVDSAYLKGCSMASRNLGFSSSMTLRALQ